VSDGHRSSRPCRLLTLETVREVTKAAASPRDGSDWRAAPPTGYLRRMTPARLVTLVCLAQVCAQVGAYTWPALLPGFIADWHISNGQAGWITGLFCAAYTVSVPFLVTLTDRSTPALSI
jgi:hypothetical protein